MSTLPKTRPWLIPNRAHPARQDSSENVVNQQTTPQPLSGAQADRVDSPSSAVALGDCLSPDQNPDETGSDFWAESEGLQPSSLLNKQAMKGMFSLQNLLTISHGLNPAKEASATLSVDDPVNKRIVSYHIATSLFEGHVSLNP